MDTTTVAAPDAASRRRVCLVAVVGAVGLVGFHLVVGVVLIPILYRTSPGRAAAPGLENLAPQGSAGQPGSGGAA
jgi:hypothetical protein